MMTMTARVLSFAVLIALTACGTSRGFDRGQLSEAVAPNQLVTEDEISRVLELRPQLTKPFKLGIFLTKPASYHWAAGWNWLPEDKDRFVDLGRSLEADGIVSQTVFISSSIAADENLKSIRLAAAHHGLDAVLVVGGVSDVDRYNNALGPLYAAFVTAFFIPATVIDGLFVSHAALWDVRNGFLYTSVEVDGESRQTRPAFMAREEEAISEAKVRSIDQLIVETRSRIRNLAARRFESSEAPRATSGQHRHSQHDQ